MKALGIIFGVGIGLIVLGTLTTAAIPATLLIGRAQQGGGWSKLSAIDGTPQHNWITPALPFIAYSSEIDLQAPWDSPANQRYFRAPLPVLINPSLESAPVRDVEGYGLAHYAANCRAMKDGGFRPLSELSNGTSTTLLIGEVNANFEPWGKPGNCRDPRRGIGKSAYGFGGPPGAGGALFGMATAPCGSSATTCPRMCSRHCRRTRS